MGYEASGSSAFSDVPSEHWANGYISAMKEKSIIGGYEDGTFGLDRKITRAEVVSIINRALNRVPSSDKLSEYIASNGYPASDLEGHWAAAQFVEAAADHSISLLH